MPFRIRSDESVHRAIRRLARKQLREAARDLGAAEPPLGERIHHTRTALKRVRALAALVRPAVGGRARKADRRLRRLGASASELRDAEILLQTFDALLPSLADEPDSASLKAARGRLVGRVRRTQRALAAEGGIERLARKLRRERRRSRRWLPRRAGWGLPRRGLVASYRDARRAMNDAYEEKTGSAFHGWRIAVKRHRYQFQLLEEVWPGEATAHVKALERLGELLGQEHDLTVLEQLIEDEPRSFPVESDRVRLLELVDRRRYTLRAEARPLGERLFAERPRNFDQRLRDELREGVRRMKHAPRYAAGTGAWGGTVHETGVVTWPGLQVI